MSYGLASETFDEQLTSEPQLPPRAVPLSLSNPALPFYAIGLIPILWLLGLGFFTFAIAAVPMGLVLLTMKPLRFPKGSGLWFLFIGWMLISAVTLEPTVNRYLSFMVRAGIYIGATILYLYIYNLPKKYLSTGKVLGMIAYPVSYTHLTLPTTPYV